LHIYLYFIFESGYLNIFISVVLKLSVLLDVSIIFYNGAYLLNIVFLPKLIF